MAFQISQFQKALNNAGARSSLFDVSLTAGAVLTKKDDQGTKATDLAVDLTFTVRATTIPGLTVTPITTTYFGREIKVPGEMEFADWSVTVLNDNGSRVRRSIGKWMAMINAHKDNKMDPDFMKQVTGGVYPWTGTLQVKQYAKEGSLLHTYEMVNAWPTSMDPIDMNYDNTGTLQEFGVTWAFDYWKYVHNSEAALSGLAPHVFK